MFLSACIGNCTQRANQGRLTQPQLASRADGFATSPAANHEPWHVQPCSLDGSRSAYTMQGAVGAQDQHRLRVRALDYLAWAAGRGVLARVLCLYLCTSQVDNALKQGAYLHRTGRRQMYVMRFRRRQPLEAHLRLLDMRIFTTSIGPVVGLNALHSDRNGTRVPNHGSGNLQMTVPGRVGDSTPRTPHLEASVT
jgi:hypothetical protein